MKAKFSNLVARYSDQTGDVIAAIEGLTESELDKRLVQGKWSIREQVTHLADSEMNMVQRMKRVIAEETPLLPAYDQDKWAARLAYEKSHVDDSIALFFTLRTTMVRVLKGLKDADFDRAGIHTENGKVTLLDLLEDAVEHANHHTKTIERIKTKFRIK